MKGVDKKVVIVSLVAIVIIAGVIFSYNQYKAKTTVQESPPTGIEKVDFATRDNLLRQIREDFARDVAENPDLAFASGSLLIRFKEGTSINEKRKIRRSVNAELIEEFTLVPNLQHIKVDKGTENQAIETLRNNKNVEYVEQDVVLRLNAATTPGSTITRNIPSPNDPLFSQQWALQNINAPEAWVYTTGSPDVVVAIIDSGVDYNDPDLANNMWINKDEIPNNGIDDDNNGYIDDVLGWDFVDNDNDPMDDPTRPHGTYTAQVVGAVGNNGIGIAGVNWNIKMIPLKILSNFRQTPLGFASNIIRALQYATDKGVRISSNSYGLNIPFIQSLYDAFNQAKTYSHLAIFAAGNSGSDNDLIPQYPCSFDSDNIICVAATNENDQLANRNYSSFSSNYGLTTVDLGAPGVDIMVSSGGRVSGTSFSAPHVSGIAALILSIHPDWNYQQIRTKILASVRNVNSLSGITVTGGITDAKNSVIGGLPADFETIPPTVIIDYPLPGASVSGTIPIEISASDNTGVRQVILTSHFPGWPNYARQHVIGLDETPPYTISWDAEAFANTAFIPESQVINLKALAIDSSYNTGVSPVIPVTVPDNFSPTIDSFIVFLGAPPFTTATVYLPVPAVIRVLEITDRSYLDYVQIFGDGELLKTCDGRNQQFMRVCEYTWQTGGLSLGKHKITIVAKDKAIAGNTLTRSIVLIKQ
ncbi:MAG: S8 family serine peptidase [Nanoarchaeota archaeon]|nr:S8 family serine peptidase [Nanoarchaeota archaeon]